MHRKRRNPPASREERKEGKLQQVRALHGGLRDNLDKSHRIRDSLQLQSGEYVYKFTLYNLNWTEVWVQVSGNVNSDCITVLYRLASSGSEGGKDDQDLELLIQLSARTSLTALCRLITSI